MMPCSSEKAFIDHLNEKFQAVDKPSEHVAFHESPIL